MSASERDINIFVASIFTFLNYFAIIALGDDVQAAFAGSVFVAIALFGILWWTT